MTTSRVPAVIDYLVATFTAAATLGQADPPVNVIDGPKVTAAPGPLALWVGCDDIDPGSSPNAAESDQQWAGLGRMARNEQLAVFCTIEARSGDNDVRSMRLLAAGVMSACEDIVRADATLGGTVWVPGNAAVTGAKWGQGPSDRGMAVRVTFTISAQARIGG